MSEVIMRRQTNVCLEGSDIILDAGCQVSRLVQVAGVIPERRVAVDLVSIDGKGLQQLTL